VDGPSEGGYPAGAGRGPGRPRWPRGANPRLRGGRRARQIPGSRAHLRCSSGTTVPSGMTCGGDCRHSDGCQPGAGCARAEGHHLDRAERAVARCSRAVMRSDRGGTEPRHQGRRRAPGRHPQQSSRHPRPGRAGAVRSLRGAGQVRLTGHRCRRPDSTGSTRRVTSSEDADCGAPAWTEQSCRSRRAPREPAVRAGRPAPRPAAREYRRVPIPSEWPRRCNVGH
jgi:hypothetical protein